jgi:hypothetical protein
VAKICKKDSENGRFLGLHVRAGDGRPGLRSEPFLIRDGFTPSYDTRDLGFQVFVRIPEPSTLVLSTLATMMLRFPRSRPRPMSKRSGDKDLGWVRASTLRG